MTNTKVSSNSDKQILGSGTSDEGYIADSEGRDWVYSATQGTVSDATWIHNWRQMRARWHPDYLFGARHNYTVHRHWDKDYMNSDYIIAVDADRDLASYGYPYNVYDQSVTVTEKSDSLRGKKRGTCPWFCIILIFILGVLITVPIIVAMILSSSNPASPSDILGKVRNEIILARLIYTEDMANASSTVFKKLATEFEKEMQILYQSNITKNQYAGSKISRVIFLGNDSMKVDYDLFFRVKNMRIPSHQTLKTILYSVERDEMDQGLGVLGDLRFRIDSNKIIESTVVRRDDLNASLVNRTILIQRDKHEESANVETNLLDTSNVGNLTNKGSPVIITTKIIIKTDKPGTKELNRFKKNTTIDDMMKSNNLQSIEHSANNSGEVVTMQNETVSMVPHRQLTTTDSINTQTNDLSEEHVDSVTKSSIEYQSKQNEHRKEDGYLEEPTFHSTTKEVVTENLENTSMISDDLRPTSLIPNKTYTPRTVDLPTTSRTSTFEADFETTPSPIFSKAVEMITASQNLTTTQKRPASKQIKVSTNQILMKPTLTIQMSKSSPKVSTTTEQQTLRVDSARPKTQKPIVFTGRPSNTLFTPFTRITLSVTPTKVFKKLATYSPTKIPIYHPNDGIIGKARNEIILARFANTEDMANVSSMAFKQLAAAFERQMQILYQSDITKKQYAGSKINRVIFLGNDSIKVYYDLFFRVKNMYIPSHEALQTILYSVERDESNQSLGVLGDLRFRIDSNKIIEITAVKRGDLNSTLVNGAILIQRDKHGEPANVETNLLNYGENLTNKGSQVIITTKKIIKTERPGTIELNRFRKNDTKYDKMKSNNIQSIEHSTNNSDAVVTLQKEIVSVVPHGRLTKADTIYTRTNNSSGEHIGSVTKSSIENRSEQNELKKEDGYLEEPNISFTTKKVVTENLENTSMVSDDLRSTSLNPNKTYAPRTVDLPTTSRTSIFEADFETTPSPIFSKAPEMMTTSQNLVTTQERSASKHIKAPTKQILMKPTSTIKFETKMARGSPKVSTTTEQQSLRVNSAKPKTQLPTLFTGMPSNTVFTPFMRTTLSVIPTKDFGQSATYSSTKIPIYHPNDEIIRKVRNEVILARLANTEDMANVSSMAFKQLAAAFERQMRILYQSYITKNQYAGSKISRVFFLGNDSMKVVYYLFFRVQNMRIPSRKTLKTILYSVERDESDQSLGVLGDLRFRIDSNKINEITAVKRGDLNSTLVNGAIQIQMDKHGESAYVETNMFDNGENGLPIIITKQIIIEPEKPRTIELNRFKKNDTIDDKMKSNNLQSMDHSTNNSGEVVTMQNETVAMVPHRQITTADIIQTNDSSEEHVGSVTKSSMENRSKQNEHRKEDGYLEESTFNSTTKKVVTENLDNTSMISDDLRPTSLIPNITYTPRTVDLPTTSRTSIFDAGFETTPSPIFSKAPEMITTSQNLVTTQRRSASKQVHASTNQILTAPTLTIKIARDSTRVSTSTEQQILRVKSAKPKTQPPTLSTGMPSNTVFTPFTRTPLSVIPTKHFGQSATYPSTKLPIYHTNGGIIRRVRNEIILARLSCTDDMANASSMAYKKLAAAFERQMRILYQTYITKNQYAGSKISRILVLGNDSIKVYYDLFFRVKNMRIPSRKKLKTILYSVERDERDQSLGVLGDLRFRIDSNKVIEVTAVKRDDLNSTLVNGAILIQMDKHGEPANVETNFIDNGGNLTSKGSPVIIIKKIIIKTEKPRTIELSRFKANDTVDDMMKSIKTQHSKIQYNNSDHMQKATVLMFPNKQFTATGILDTQTNNSWDEHFKFVTRSFIENGNIQNEPAQDDRYLVVTTQKPITEIPLRNYTFSDALSSTSVIPNKTYAARRVDPPTTSRTSVLDAVFETTALSTFLKVRKNIVITQNTTKGQSKTASKQIKVKVNQVSAKPTLTINNATRIARDSRKEVTTTKTQQQSSVSSTSKSTITTHHPTIFIPEVTTVAQQQMITGETTRDSAEPTTSTSQSTTEANEQITTTTLHPIFQAQGQSSLASQPTTEILLQNNIKPIEKADENSTSTTKPVSTSVFFQTTEDEQLSITDSQDASKSQKIKNSTNKSSPTMSILNDYSPTAFLAAGDQQSTTTFSEIFTKNQEPVTSLSRSTTTTLYASTKSLTTTDNENITILTHFKTAPKKQPTTATSLPKMNEQSITTVKAYVTNEDQQGTTPSQFIADPKEPTTTTALSANTTPTVYPSTASLTIKNLQKITTISQFITEPHYSTTTASSLPRITTPNVYISTAHRSKMSMPKFVTDFQDSSTTKTSSTVPLISQAIADDQPTHSQFTTKSQESTTLSPTVTSTTAYVSTEFLSSADQRLLTNESKLITQSQEPRTTLLPVMTTPTVHTSAESQKVDQQPKTTILKNEIEYSEPSTTTTLFPKTTTPSAYLSTVNEDLQSITITSQFQTESQQPAILPTMISPTENTSTEFMTIEDQNSIQTISKFVNEAQMQTTTADSFTTIDTPTETSSNQSTSVEPPTITDSTNFIPITEANALLPTTIIQPTRKISSDLTIGTSTRSTGIPLVPPFSGGIGILFPSKTILVGSGRNTKLIRQGSQTQNMVVSTLANPVIVRNQLFPFQPSFGSDSDSLFPSIGRPSGLIPRKVETTTIFNPSFEYLWSLGDTVLDTLLSREKIFKTPDRAWDNEHITGLNDSEVSKLKVENGSRFVAINQSDIDSEETNVIQNIDESVLNVGIPIAESRDILGTINRNSLINKTVTVTPQQDKTTAFFTPGNGIPLSLDNPDLLSLLDNLPPLVRNTTTAVRERSTTTQSIDDTRITKSIIPTLLDLQLDTFSASTLQTPTQNTFANPTPKARPDGNEISPESPFDMRSNNLLGFGGLGSMFGGGMFGILGNSDFLSRERSRKSRKNSTKTITVTNKQPTTVQTTQNPEKTILNNNSSKSNVSIDSSVSNNLEIKPIISEITRFDSSSNSNSSRNSQISSVLANEGIQSKASNTSLKSSSPNDISRNVDFRGLNNNRNSNEIHSRVSETIIVDDSNFDGSRNLLNVGNFGVFGNFLNLDTNDILQPSLTVPNLRSPDNIISTRNGGSISNGIQPGAIDFSLPDSKSSNRTLSVVPMLSEFSSDSRNGMNLFPVPNTPDDLGSLDAFDISNTLVGKEAITVPPFTTIDTNSTVDKISLTLNSTAFQEDTFANDTNSLVFTRERPGVFSISSSDILSNATEIGFLISTTSEQLDGNQTEPITHNERRPGGADITSEITTEGFTTTNFVVNSSLALNDSNQSMTEVISRNTTSSSTNNVTSVPDLLFEMTQKAYIGYPVTLVWRLFSIEGWKFIIVQKEIPNASPVIIGVVTEQSMIAAPGFSSLSISTDSVFTSREALIYVDIPSVVCEDEGMYTVRVLGLSNIVLAERTDFLPIFDIPVLQTVGADNLFQNSNFTDPYCVASLGYPQGRLFLQVRYAGDQSFNSFMSTPDVENATLTSACRKVVQVSFGEYLNKSMDLNSTDLRCGVVDTPAILNKDGIIFSNIVTLNIIPDTVCNNSTTLKTHPFQPCNFIDCAKQEVIDCPQNTCFNSTSNICDTVNV